MSKRVIAIQNHTDKIIWLTVTAPGGLFRKLEGKIRHAVEFSLPENSASTEYWYGQHVFIQVMNEYSNELQFQAFWGNDGDGKILQTGYYGYEWPNIEVRPTLQSRINRMKGGDKGGDNARVAIHVFEHPPKSERYELRAVVLSEAEQRKRLADNFKTFKKNLSLSAGAKPTTEAIRTYMAHPAFRALSERAQESGFHSTALVWGGGGSLGVGVEVLSGLLADAGKEALYHIKSSAVTVGAEEGVAGFVGLYLSTEHAAEVGGLEFFEELGVDLEVGMAIRVFTTFSGEGGIVILLSDGEELELSVGLGETGTSRLA